MIIIEPGLYELTENIITRGASNVGTLPKGVKIKVTQVDEKGKKVIASQLSDWTHYDLPVKRI